MAYSFTEKKRIRNNFGSRESILTEPAISRFDWPFPPSHKSSPNFSKLVGSVLHSILLELQPDHGKITRFRVYRT